MGKLLQNKGFTLIEMMLVLLITSLLTVMMFVSMREVYETNVNLIIDDIVMCQFKAIIESEKQYYEDYNIYLSFNRKGNVNMANTYIIELNRHCIVVLLGTGRMYGKY